MFFKIKESGLEFSSLHNLLAKAGFLFYVFFYHCIYICIESQFNHSQFYSRCKISTSVLYIFNLYILVFSFECHFVASSVNLTFDPQFTFLCSVLNTLLYSALNVVAHVQC